MDWFERLTGFRELDYERTRERLEVAGRALRSRVNGRSYGIGELELVSPQSLRDRALSGGGPAGRLKVREIVGDVRRLHRAREYEGALFQVASQFNLLEMVSPDVTPEDGVTRYQCDRTQGPACAIAAGAATIYRNYFVPVGDAAGQTRHRQLDALAGLGDALAQSTGCPQPALWTMRNGYALCSERGLAAISAHLCALDEQRKGALRDLLHIGLHRDVEVADGDLSQRQFVSQAFCSALPVAYSGIAAADWQPFATLVLEAAYEATLWAAALNVQHGRSNIVLLTRLGGGAFGNDGRWIDAALRRAFAMFGDFDLDVRLVRYGSAGTQD
jgi:hypothetical protein